MKRFCAILGGFCLLMAIAGNASASGFAIIEQSVSGLGNAYAGAAATAEDASTIYFNPAGMTLLEGQQVVGGNHIVVPQTEFQIGEGTNAALGTETSGNGANIAVVPNLFYTNKLNDRVAVGFGIFAPFGMSTEYDKDWVGRYHAVESDVMTINFNPSIAYKVTDKLSVGVGASVQYIDVTLSSMVNTGAAFGGTDTDLDTFVENTADDWGFGFNLGLLYEITEATRVGLAYRSEIAHRVQGEVKSDVPDALEPFIGGLFTTQDVYGEIDLPASASASVYHQVNDKLAVMADVTWTGWSSFQELDIRFEGAGIAGQPNSLTEENWEDTWRYSIGANYQATEEMLLRAGVAYDETPIPDAEHRTPRIPGTDRIWLSLGMNYKISDNFTADLGYTHLFVDNSEMNAEDESPLGLDVVGEFENSVDIFSAQLTYNF